MMRAVAVAISLTIVLQILAVTGHAHFPIRDFDSAKQVAVSVETPCLGDQRGVDEFPNPAHAEHPSCCLYCSERSHNGMLFEVVAAPDVTIEPIRGLIVLGACRISSDRIRPPLGWTSTWSSRAPPSFS